MPKTRKSAAGGASGLRVERWDVLGFLGFMLGALGLLALIGQFSRDGLVVAAVGTGMAEIVGRAAPLAALALLVLGPVILVAGARRRLIIGRGHLAAVLLFVTALTALADLAARDGAPAVSQAGGWIGRRVGDGLFVSVGLGPAYLILGLAAVASLAFAITALPWGVTAIRVLGRGVIVAVNVAARAARRAGQRLGARAKPLFRPAGTDSDRPRASEATADSRENPAGSAGPPIEPPENPAEWRQEPLIRLRSEADVELEPPSGDGRWELPPLDLLKRPQGEARVSTDEIRAKATLIEDTLASFGIEATVAEAIPGPVVTQYLLRPGPGVKVARITALANDLALKLSARSIRIEAPVPGQPYVGLETPNDDPLTVTVREVMESEAWVTSKAGIRLALGKDVVGDVRVVDITAMPHLLVAGATGAGKSVCLTSLLTCLLYQLNPDELQLILIDPKMVELVTFESVPHLRMPVITDVNDVVPVLTWVSNEMARRYRIFNKAGVRNVDRYNADPTDETNGQPLPYLIVVIDELADLMMTTPGDVERLLARLAQMARATGIHLVISTQRPSVDVVTGLIKANFPTRISFMVSSQADSRTILDGAGAERLIGRGDMLYAPPEGGKPIRIQGVYAGDDEIKAVVEHWRAQGEPELVSTDALSNADTIGENEDKPLFVEATELVMRHESITPDLLSRELRIGRSKALKLAHRLQVDGFVGPPDEPQSLRRRVLQRDPAD